MDNYIKPQRLRNGQILLILPCNAAACIGDYFRADVYTKKGWNTWKEADKCLRGLRAQGRVIFAALDSSTLETEPSGAKGAIVFETEMHRAKNPTGEDWGAPNWRWFKPKKSGKCEYLEALTESIVKGIKRVEDMGFSQVFALVNPRGYFLSLAAAVDRCGLLNKWVLFRIPSHPRHLIPAVRQISPIIYAASDGKQIKGNIYFLPELFPFIQKESKIYRDNLPEPWKKYSNLPKITKIKRQWGHLSQRND